MPHHLSLGLRLAPLCLASSPADRKVRTDEEAVAFAQPALNFIAAALESGAPLSGADARAPVEVPSGACQLASGTAASGVLPPRKRH